MIRDAAAAAKKHTRAKKVGRDKNSFLHKLSRFFMWGMVAGIIMFILAIGGFWLVIANYYSPRQLQNIVFVSNLIDRNRGLLLFAHIDQAAPKLKLYQLTQEFNFPPPSPFLSDADDANKLAASHYSFALTTVVDEVIEVGDLATVETKTQLINGGLRQLISPNLSLSKRLHLIGTLLAIQSIPNQFVQFEKIQSLESWNRLSADQRGFLGTRECAIAVVNTTPSSRLATKVTQILENSGLFVIRVTDTHTNIEESLVVFDDHKPCQSVGPHLQSLLPSGVPPAQNIERAKEYRGNLVILLGNDVAEVKEWFDSSGSGESGESSE